MNQNFNFFSMYDVRIGPHSHSYLMSYLMLEFLIILIVFFVFLTNNEFEFLK